MKRITFLLIAVAMLVGGAVVTVPASRHAAQEATPLFVTQIPPGYRDWRLISVAREEGALNDIRVSSVLYSREGTIERGGGIFWLLLSAVAV